MHARQAVCKYVDSREMPIEDMRAPDAFDETKAQQHCGVRHEPNRVLDKSSRELIGRI
jgi:hypothetical protein